MTRTTWFAVEMLWKLMAVLALTLGLTARAETLAERQRASSRHALATSQSRSMIIGEGGAIWVWGTGSGEGLGTWPELEVGSSTPVRMPRMTGAVSLATGIGSGHSLALLEDGSVEAWGANFDGQLGDGTRSYRRQRVKVLGMTDAVDISVGHMHSLAVRRDGTVWAWGSNWYGQLGDGTTISRSRPAQVLGLTNIVAVSAGGSHSLVLSADGTVWAWGSNWQGQLGDGTQEQQLSPVQVVGLTDVVSLETRNGTSYAVRADGTVWAWGTNFSGELGGGSQDFFQTTPVQVPGLTGVVGVAAGYAHALALRQDGTVWAWGTNYTGQLGTGTVGDISLPQQVQGLHGVVEVAAGLEHSMALRKNGSLWTWGRNREGAMGTGTERQDSPVLVRGLKDVRAISSHFFHEVAVRNDGSVWEWGMSQSAGGAIQAAPERVKGLSDVVAVAAGSTHALAVRQDGTVWTWGDNTWGQLGDGTFGGRRGAPAQVEGLKGVVAVAAGEYHSLALMQDGTVWAWGANYFGQVGDLSLVDQPMPVQVQELKGVVAVYASGDLSVALGQDGLLRQWGSDWSVWYWGDMQAHTPEVVPDLAEVVKVSMLGAGLTALLADGTVWQWYVTSTWDPFPAWPLEGLADAVDVAWSASTTQVLRADGTVWNIGGNTYGERGFPSSEGYSLELKQVPGLTGVVSLTAGSGTIHALREDGSLVGWGSNMYGTVGNGVSPEHLKPTRVLLPCKLKGLTAEESIREQQQCHAEP